MLCIVIVLLLTAGGEILLSAFAVRASAADIDITSSSVRDDLASMEKDHLSYLSSQENIFISMAQYYDGEDVLRTYVYFNYIGSLDAALTISISTAVMDGEYNITDHAEMYDLAFVDNESTWVKYEVLGLPNLDNVTRRYKLEGIYSSSVSFLDLDEVFIFHGITNETIEVFHQEVETITITEKEVHFFCYGEESKWYDFWGLDEYLGYGKKYTDAWYIFFNTDRHIDELKEIEITFVPYEYRVQVLGPAKMNMAFTEDVLDERKSADFDEETTKTYGSRTVVTIAPGTTRVSASDNWWGGYQTKYQDIENVMDLREYDLSDSEGNPFVFAEQAKKYTWGVNFLTSEKTTTFKGINGMGVPLDTQIIEGTGVCDTAIIRLKYEVNGMVKNCYAIDVPTDDFIGNSAEEDFENKEWWQKIVALLMLGIFVSLLGPFLSPILTAFIQLLWFAVKALFNLILWLVLFPFRLLGRLFRDK